MPPICYLGNTIQMNQFTFLALLILMTSCANYRFLYRKNPLGQYEIDSLSIPMFFNKSPIPNTGPIFTREFSQYLSSFQDLKVYSGINPKSDAVLLGIIYSAKSIGETITVTDTKLVSTLIAPGDIGSRTDFFTPTQNRVNLNLKLILIKSPSYKELENIDRLTSMKGTLPPEIYKKLLEDPRILFNEDFSLSVNFDREIRSFEIENRPGDTNFTNNQGNLNKLLKTMAVQGRDYFRDLIIYAF